MNNLLKLESIEECKYCSQSSILLSSSSSSTSSNFKDKEYFLYFQNNNLTLFESDEIGMVVLDEVEIRYCMFCGRVLIG